MSGLVSELHEKYPHAEPPTVVNAVVHAWRGVESFALSADSAAAELLRLVAERELRLRIGLDSDDARLDPETHRR